MLRKLVSCVLFSILLTSILIVAITIPAKSQDTITVPDDYPTIQDAINAATDGDTVFVRNGTYYENVIVDKTVSLVGEDKTETIVNGNGSGNVMEILASSVQMSKFTVRNGSEYYPGSGIIIDHATSCIISNCLLINNRDGISLFYSSDNTLENNDFLNNSRGGHGIRLDGSSNNFIVNNRIISNNMYGIFLYDSSNNTVAGSILRDNEYGIVVQLSGHNGIYGNNISKSRFGIDLSYTSANGISENVVSESSWSGIYIASSSSNNITRNTVRNSTYGFDFGSTGIQNYLAENNILENEVGIWIRNISNNNTIIHSNFVNNSKQIQSNGTVNFWNNGCEGNYWSNYNGSDLDNDGVGDEYLPWEGVDSYPLMSSYMSGDINHDAIVDIFDVVKIAVVFGCSSADPQWNPHCDVNEDGLIDIFDLVTVAVNFGKEWTPP